MLELSIIFVASAILILSPDWHQGLLGGFDSEKAPPGSPLVVLAFATNGFRDGLRTH
jgi:hypothetical protein